MKLLELPSNRSGSGAVVRSTLARDGPSGVQRQSLCPPEASLSLTAGFSSGQSKKDFYLMVTRSQSGRESASAVKKSFCFFFFRGFNSEMHSE